MGGYGCHAAAYTLCLWNYSQGKGAERHMELSDMNVSDRAYIFPSTVGEKYNSFHSLSCLNKSWEDE